MDNKQTYFLDTNALLTLCEDLESPEYDGFNISQKSLEEIENIKTNDRKDQNVKYRARRVSRILDSGKVNFNVVVTDKYVMNVANKSGIEIIPDTIICSAAKVVAEDNPEMIFLCDDISCKNIARKVFGLNVQSANKKEKIYKGYLEIEGTSEYITDVMCNDGFKSQFVENEYLIIHNTDTQKYSEMRFTNGGFVNLKLPSSKYIKGKNSLQRCAIDMLNNKDITIAACLGTYGSGKSYLTSRMALYHVNEMGDQSCIECVREPVGEGRETGYLPGELDDKIKAFMLPFAQQLDGGEYEMQALQQKGVINATTPYYLKGQTFNSTIIWSDEAEDLTEKQLRLIGTRVGENSAIYFSGDYKQSIVNESDQNALVKMCNILKGNPKFACVYLEDDVRSSTSKIFADLFK